MAKRLVSLAELDEIEGLVEHHRNLQSRLEHLEASPTYVHRIISSLRGWFGYLQEVEELTESNPAAELSKPKLRDKHPPAMSVSEVSALIRAAVEHSRRPERLRNWTLIAFLGNNILEAPNPVTVRFEVVGPIPGRSNDDVGQLSCLCGTWAEAPHKGFDFRPSAITM